MECLRQSSYYSHILNFWLGRADEIPKKIETAAHVGLVFFHTKSLMLTYAYVCAHNKFIVIDIPTLALAYYTR